MSPHRLATRLSESLYTYGKQLLTPGQRLGYIALPPAMPERPEVRRALFSAQLATGFDSRML